MQFHTAANFDILVIYRITRKGNHGKDYAGYFEN